MKTILLFLSALAIASAKKEHSDILDGILEDPKLAEEFYKVVKRLGLDIGDKHLSDLKQAQADVVDDHDTNPPTCRNNVYRNTIIRTSDSRKAGAKFLVSVENVKSNEQCSTECCKTDGCDLSVYGEGNKTKHNCYLFRCKDQLTNENKCLFNNYTGYVSSTVSKISSPQVKPASKSQDIEDADLLKEWKEPKTTPSQPPTTTRPKPTLPPTERPHTVGLGDVCHSKFSCEDPNAQCSEGLCQCRDTFYKKLRICRQICIVDKEYECRARGTSRRGPDCIAVSLVCDGTHDCADGSDEQNCPTQVATMAHSSWLDKTSPQDSVEENSDDVENDGQLSSSDNPDSSDINHYGYPPLDPSRDWDYSEDNSDQLEKAFTLKSMDEDSAPVASPTDSYLSSSKSNSNTEDSIDDDLNKEYDMKEDLKPKNTMPIISWAGDQHERDRKIENKQTLQDQLSYGLKDPVNDVQNQRDEDVSQDRSQNINSHKSDHHLIPSKPRGDRPEALPRPTQPVQSSPSITIPRRPVSQTLDDDSVKSNTNTESKHFDNEDWTDYVKSDLPSPLKPADSTPDSELPYSTKMDYQQGLPYRHGRPFQPMPPYQPSPQQYGPNQAPQQYGANQAPPPRYGANQQLPPRYGPNQPGRYHNYRYPSYNQQYTGYNTDYQDYDPYLPDQDLEHSDIQPPAEPNYVNENPGGGYRPKAGKPGKLPNPVGKTTIGSHEETNDKSLEPPQPKTPHHLPATDIADKKPGSDVEQPHRKFDVHHSSATKNNKDDTNIHRKTQMKTDSMKDVKGKETDASSVKDTTPHKDDSAVKPSKSKNPVKSHDEVKSEENKVEVVEEKETFVTKEKVIVTSFTDGAEGPIVALSLGLAITLVLLVFVGCRLRNVRRRLRKGRPLHSNEADYLINGMYL